MAFRIADSVVCGEIDNRVKGVVTGKVWLNGRDEPLVLELQGNACADLAGCLMNFENKKECVIDPSLDSLTGVQRGSIGDLTASRKVRVFDVPVKQAFEMSKRGEKPPEHLANCVYLEWFSEANGRVVVESVDFNIRISAPEWRLTHEEIAQRSEQAARGMIEFMERLKSALEENEKEKDDPEDERL